MIVLLKSVFVRKYCSYKQGVFFVILMFVPQTWKPYHYRQWAANVYSWPLSISVLQRATLWHGTSLNLYGHLSWHSVAEHVAVNTTCFQTPNLPHARQTVYRKRLGCEQCDLWASRFHITCDLLITFEGFSKS